MGSILLLSLLLQRQQHTNLSIIMLMGTILILQHTDVFKLQYIHKVLLPWCADYIFPIIILLITSYYAFYYLNNELKVVHYTVL